MRMLECSLDLNALYYTVLLIYLKILYTAKPEKYIALSGFILDLPLIIVMLNNCAISLYKTEVLD